MLGVFWPLAGMLLLQTPAVQLFLTVPVLAPVLADQIGIEASRIGIYTSVVFLAAMWVSLAVGPAILRFGGVRMAQAGLAGMAAALLLTNIGWLPAILASAILIGISYGPNTPAGSHVLARVTPPRLRALVFSIKQSGAPLGGVLAGLFVPFMVSQAGWQAAVWATAALALTAAVLVQPLRARLDDDRRPDLRLSFAKSLGSLRLLR